MYLHLMKTFSMRKEDISKKWLLIDANKAILGRLAVISANILRGKNKAEYTPNQDCGDNLIIINADKIHLTGKKETDKIYYRHTGHPGGLKETNPEQMRLKNKSTDIIKLAIKRMIPSGPLGYKQLSNCKIYSGSEHLHTAQNPETLDISKYNNKNMAR
jgi:large subunit ribosomal protein L13